jgi:lipid-binding SYLF domain-containing protein
MAVGSTYAIGQEIQHAQDTPYSADTEDAERAHEQARSSERSELKQIADEAIAEVKSSENVSVDMEGVAGYAVFDATKAGLIATGSGGTGIAIDNDSGEETYMHVGGAGIGLGAGVQNYRLVLVFEDHQDFAQFVDGQWSGSASAQAAAGQEGASEEVQSLEDVMVYRVSDEGLIAQVDVSGMRFWPDDDLNQKS